MSLDPDHGGRADPIAFGLSSSMSKGSFPARKSHVTLTSRRAMLPDKRISVSASNHRDRRSLSPTLRLVHLCERPRDRLHSPTKSLLPISAHRGKNPKSLASAVPSHDYQGRMSETLDQTRPVQQFLSKCGSFCSDVDCVDVMQAVKDARAKYVKDKQAELITTKNTDDDDNNTSGGSVEQQQQQQQQQHNVNGDDDHDDGGDRGFFLTQINSETNEESLLDDEVAAEIVKEIVERANDHVDDMAMTCSTSPSDAPIEVAGPLEHQSVGIRVVRQPLLAGLQIHSIAESSFAALAGLSLNETIVSINEASVLHMDCESAINIFEECWHDSKAIKLKVVSANIPNTIVDLASIKGMTKSAVIKRPLLPKRYSALSQEAFDHALIVENLDLRNQSLTAIPEQIDRFENLRVLELADNNIEFLPDTIGNLDKLTKLDLSRNGLKQLPKTIGNLIHLESLYLFEDRLLKTLPPSISGLVSLQTLNLPHNSLRFLPDSISELKSLQTLWLTDNKLTTLPDLSGLQNLQKLILDDNLLTVIPFGIRGAKHLKVLSLNNCDLNEIPEWIGGFSLLQELHVRKNKLTSLPASIGNLTLLQELDLSYNKLTTLPLQMSQLILLTTMFMHENRFKVLPHQMSSLENLQVVNVGMVVNHVCSSIQCCCFLLFDEYFPS